MFLLKAYLLATAMLFTALLFITKKGGKENQVARVVEAILAILGWVLFLDQMGVFIEL
jgi:hypothetical protein